MLYQFVAQWNGYFDAMIYLDDSKLQPLQLVIRSILIQNSTSTGMIVIYKYGWKCLRWPNY